jgi:hypothetical protein
MERFLKRVEFLEEKLNGNQPSKAFYHEVWRSKITLILMGRKGGQMFRITGVLDFVLCLEKFQNPSNSKCYIPSSESFRLYG